LDGAAVIAKEYTRFAGNSWRRPPVFQRGSDDGAKRSLITHHSGPNRNRSSCIAFSPSNVLIDNAGHFFVQQQGCPNQFLTLQERYHVLFATQAAAG
jgi:hypothetical protein